MLKAFAFKSEIDAQFSSKRGKKEEGKAIWAKKIEKIGNGRALNVKI